MCDEHLGKKEDWKWKAAEGTVCEKMVDNGVGGLAMCEKDAFLHRSVNGELDADPGPFFMCEKHFREAFPEEPKMDGGIKKKLVKRFHENVTGEGLPFEELEKKFGKGSEISRAAAGFLAGIPAGAPVHVLPSEFLCEKRIEQELGPTIGTVSNAMKKEASKNGLDLKINPETNAIDVKMKAPIATGALKKSVTSKDAIASFNKAVEKLADAFSREFSPFLNCTKRVIETANVDTEETSSGVFKFPDGELVTVPDPNPADGWLLVEADELEPDEWPERSYYFPTVNHFEGELIVSEYATRAEAEQIEFVEFREWTRKADVESDEEEPVVFPLLRKEYY